MAFFDDRPHYVPPNATAQRQFDDWYSNGRYQAGLGRRPRLEIPVIVALESRILAQTADIAVAIPQIEAYRSGIGFSLMLRFRGGFAHGDLALGSQVLRPRTTHDSTAGPLEPVPAQALRFGVQFADGETATNLDVLTPAEEHALSRPVLAVDGGRRHDLDVWLRPLPPPGSLTFVCEWPAYDIAETRLQVDGQSVHAAGKHSTVLWPSPHTR